MSNMEVEKPCRLCLHSTKLKTQVLLTSSKHGSEHDATGPDVCRLSIKLGAGHQLRCNVGQRAAQACQLALTATVPEHGGQSEICDLQMI